MNPLQKILLEIFRWPIVTLWHLSGWKTSQPLPDDPKVIIIAAPHTTNWDFVMFLLAALEQRRRPYVTFKKEWFFPPFKWILPLLGGIPIDRARASNVVNQMVQRIEEHETILLVFTPEGTRKYTEYWKTGFYYVAQQANIPILCGAINYRTKTIYLDLMFNITGDIEEDFEKIRLYYEEFGYGKYPEKMSKITLRQRDVDRHNRQKEEESSKEAVSEEITKQAENQ